MSWVKLDDKFWAHPKVQRIGNEGAGAFCRMLSYCGDHLTDGLLPGETVSFIAKPKVIDKLAEFGFIASHGEDWKILDYLDFNPSRTEVEATRATRVEAGRKGGQKSRPGGSNGEANA